MKAGATEPCSKALKGLSRGVILSVLCDHMLLLHPEQSARLEHKQPALWCRILTKAVSKFLKKGQVIALLPLIDSS